MTRQSALSHRRWAVELLLVLATSLVLMLVLLARTAVFTPDHPSFAVPQDLQQYIHMALTGVFDHHIAPYGWRVGTPLIVSSLPLDYVQAFFLVSFSSLWLTAVAIYYLVRQFDFPRGVALTALVGFISLGWAVKFNLQDFWLTEPPAFLLLTLGMLMLAKGRPIVASGLMAVSALFRESGLVLAPLFYTMRARRLVDLRAAVQAFVLILPALLVLVAMRLLIPAWNEDADYVAKLPPVVQFVVRDAVPTYDLLAVVERSIQIRMDALAGPEGLYYLFTLTLGVYGIPVTVMAVIGGLADRRLLARVGLMLLVPYVQLVLATNSERLFVVGFPAAMVLAAAGVSFLMTRLGISFLPFLLSALALYAAQLIDREMPEPRVVVQASLLAVLGVLVVGWARVLRTDRPPSPRSAPQ